MPDGQKSLADVAPDSGIHQCYTPIRWISAKHFHIFAEIGDHEISVCRWLKIEEVILDNISLITKAEDKVPVPILTIVLHNVQEHRMRSDWDHRLWNAFGIVANSRS